MVLNKKNKVDPGFWIGLLMIAAFLYLTYRCRG